MIRNSLVCPVIHYLHSKKKGPNNAAILIPETPGKIKTLEIKGEKFYANPALSIPGFVQVTPSLFSNSLLWIWPLSCGQHRIITAVLCIQATDFQNEHR